uniref:CUB domain-containing protein n=1 Tax=Syphacia muris TaxID=451379 RepID=A0A0N5AR42_9BILA
MSRLRLEKSQLRNKLFDVSEAVCLLCFSAIFTLITEANGKQAAVRYRKVGSCGENGEGIRVEVSNQQEHFCYLLINSAARIGVKKFGIPIDHMVVVSDHVQLTLSDGDSTGGNLTLTGDTAPGTFVSIRYRYQTQENPKSEISFFTESTGLASIRFSHSDITISRDRKTDVTAKSFDAGIKELGSRKHEVFVLFMNQYLKLYIDNAYIGDYPYPGRVDAVRQMSIWGNLAPDSIMQGTIANSVKSVYDADSYCRHRHSGHLLVYANKVEQNRLDAIFDFSRSPHSLFEVFGIEITKDGVLESYDGTNTSYIFSLLEGSKSFLKKGQCLYRFRYGNFDGKGYKDTIGAQDCNLPIATFICRSRISREAGGVTLAASAESSESPIMFYLCITGYIILIIVSIIGTIFAIHRPSKLSSDDQSNTSYQQDNVYDEPPPQQQQQQQQQEPEAEPYSEPAPSTVPPPPPLEDDEPLVHYAATDPSSTALAIHDDNGDSDDY